MVDYLRALETPYLFRWKAENTCVVSASGLRYTPQKPICSVRSVCICGVYDWVIKSMQAHLSFFVFRNILFIGYYIHPVEYAEKNFHSMFSCICNKQRIYLFMFLHKCLREMEGKWYREQDIYILVEIDTGRRKESEPRFRWDSEFFVIPKKRMEALATTARKNYGKVPYCHIFLRLTRLMMECNWWSISQPLDRRCVVKLESLIYRRIFSCEHK